jgi:hypothetical protein
MRPGRRVTKQHLAESHYVSLCDAANAIRNQEACKRVACEIQILHKADWSKFSTHLAPKISGLPVPPERCAPSNVSIVS